MCKQKDETRMGMVNLFSHLDKFEEPIIVVDPKLEFIPEPFASIDIRQRKIRNRCAIGVPGKGIEIKTLALWAKEFGIESGTTESVNLQKKIWYTCEEAIDYFRKQELTQQSA